MQIDDLINRQCWRLLPRASFFFRQEAALSQLFPINLSDLSAVVFVPLMLRSDVMISAGLYPENEGASDGFGNDQRAHNRSIHPV